MLFDLVCKPELENLFRVQSRYESLPSLSVLLKLGLFGDNAERSNRFDLSLREKPISEDILNENRGLVSVIT